MKTSTALVLYVLLIQTYLIPTMSALRMRWDADELSLLRVLHSRDPGMSYPKLTRAFNKRNYRYRTSNAVKCKVRALKQHLANSTWVTTRSVPLVSNIRHLSNERYVRIGPGIFIPQHPLITEARQNAVASLINEYAGGGHLPEVFPSLLEKSSAQELSQEEIDRAAFMGYVQFLESRRETYFPTAGQSRYQYLSV